MEKTTEEKRKQSTEKNAERIARKVSLAKERDTRVLIARTPDTHRILDIVRQADRGIQILRNNLLIRFTPEEVLPILDKYQGIIRDLDALTREISEKSGVPYRSPRNLEASKTASENGKDTPGIV